MKVLKCGTATPSRLDASPQESSQLESDQQSSQLHLPGPRNGLVGHRSWSPTNNHHNCYPQVTKAVSHLLCVDQHRTTVCTSHTSATLPEKGCVDSVSPDTPRMKKTVHVPVPFAPLSLTRLDSFPDPCFRPSTTTESPLST